MRFQLPITATDADIDELDHVSNLVYLRWVLDAATSHSAAKGWGHPEYRALGSVFIVRRHELDYLAATFAGDELMLGTWIQQCDAKFTMWRAYQIVRKSDGKTVLRGRTQWVCIDMKSGRPKRMPPEFVAAYQPWPDAPQA